MVNGVAHGKGTFFFPGGEKYYGNFENGIMEGNGIFYWEDGSRWEGTQALRPCHWLSEAVRRNRSCCLK